MGTPRSIGLEWNIMESTSIRRAGNAKFRKVQTMIHLQSLNNKEKPFECLICEKRFAVEMNLTLHIRLHGNEFRYKCPFCAYSALVKNNLEIHIRKHTGEVPFECKLCERGFSGQSALSRHIQIHTGEKPFQCNRCEQEFKDSSTLKRHLKIHENIKEKHDSPKEFTHTTQLTAPTPVHNAIKEFKCSICSAQFSYKSNLYRHERLHNFLRESKPGSFPKVKQESRLTDNSHNDADTDTEFKCEQCGKNFQWKANLLRHKRAHDDIKEFKCTVCSAEFTYKTNLIRHAHVHAAQSKVAVLLKDVKQETNLTPNLIPNLTPNLIPNFTPNLIPNLIPNFTPNLIPNLTPNLTPNLIPNLTPNLTTNLTPNLTPNANAFLTQAVKIEFKCDICGRDFKKKANLVRHHSVHNSVKGNGQQDIKPDVFAQKSQPSSTAPAQLGDRPRDFKCGACANKFSSKQHLARHSRTHTKEKPFSCEVCNKAFKEKFNLNSHLLSHSNKFPFKCPNCPGSKFKAKSQLRRHEKRQGCLNTQK